MFVHHTILRHQGAQLPGDEFVRRSLGELAPTLPVHVLQQLGSLHDGGLSTFLQMKMKMLQERRRELAQVVEAVHDQVEHVAVSAGQQAFYRRHLPG